MAKEAESEPRRVRHRSTFGGCNIVQLPDASDLLEGRLGRVPSIFGRLVCLAKDPPLTSYFAKGLPPHVVRHVHCKLFRQWLGLDLKAKEADLLPYLGTLGNNLASIRMRRLIIRLCRDIIPMEASRNEMDLFIGTVETILQSLAHQETEG